MADGPFVSVVIPSFDRSAKLLAAVESVRAQTYADLEILVVDDGSTDDSYEVASRLAKVEPRLRVLRHGVNAGAQAARNTGIRAATGEWVAFLDSDDTYMPDSIERRLQTAMREDTAAVHGECVVVRAGGVMELFGIPPMMGDIRAMILASPGPAFQALLVRRDCLDDIGGLDESIVAFQEWETAIRLSAVARFSFVPEPTFVYDTTTRGALSRNRRGAAKGYEQVVMKHSREMLRRGGPPLLAQHLREAARQRRIAGQPFRSVARFVVGVIVWPADIRGIIRSARAILSAERGVGEE